MTSHINLLFFSSLRPSSTCCRTFMCNSEPLCQFYIGRVADTRIDRQYHSGLWKHQCWGLMAFFLPRSPSYISVSQMSGTDWSRLFSLKRKTCVDTHILLWRLSTSSSSPGYLFHFFICFISLCMWFWDGVLLSTCGWLNVHCVARAHLGWPLSMVPKTEELRD